MLRIHADGFGHGHDEEIEPIDQESKRDNRNTRSHPGQEGPLVGGMVLQERVELDAGTLNWTMWAYRPLRKILPDERKQLVGETSDAVPYNTNLWYR